MRLTLALVIAFVALAHSGVAAAGSDEQACQSIDSQTLGCTFTHSEGVPGAPSTKGSGGTGHRGSGSRPRGRGRPAPSTAFYDGGTTADGRSCYRVGHRPVAGGADPKAAQDAADRQFEDKFLNTHGHVNRCPDPDPAPSRPAAAGAPGGGIDIRAELQQRLPSPAPRIRPGRAITGKEAFLEIAGAGPQSYLFGNPIGEGGVAVQATPSYTVDWGDGTVTETTSNGGPWPDGDVRHTYENVGHYDVVVTARWRARSAAPTADGDQQGGELEGLHTEGRIDGFPVTQVQSIRER